MRTCVFGYVGDSVCVCVCVCVCARAFKLQNDVVHFNNFDHQHLHVGLLQVFRDVKQVFEELAS